MPKSKGSAEDPGRAKFPPPAWSEVADTCALWSWIEARRDALSRDLSHWLRVLTDSKYAQECAERLSQTVPFLASVIDERPDASPAVHDYAIQTHRGVARQMVQQRQRQLAELCSELGPFMKGRTGQPWKVWEKHWGILPIPGSGGISLVWNALRLSPRLQESLLADGGSSIAKARREAREALASCLADVKERAPARSAAEAAKGLPPAAFGRAIQETTAITDGFLWATWWHRALCVKLAEPEWPEGPNAHWRGHVEEILRDKRVLDLLYGSTGARGKRSPEPITSSPLRTPAAGPSGAARTAERLLLRPLAIVERRHASEVNRSPRTKPVHDLAKQEQV